MQLSTALQAGLSLLDGLEIIRQQQHKTAAKKMLDKLIKAVSSGQSLSEAMAAQKKFFSSLYLSMIRVGETGGILDQTTAQLTKLLQRDEKIRTGLKNASAYPVFVLSVGLISVIIILTWILPNILATLGSNAAILILKTIRRARGSPFTIGL